MGAWSDVETPDVLDVHDREDSPAPPAEVSRPAHDCVGNGGELDTVGVEPENVESDPDHRVRRDGRPGGAEEVAAAHDHRTRLAALDRGRELRVTCQVNRSIRDGHHLAPRRRV